ncbi:hypothetical protein RKD27_004943 [Streptomyces sp. SAI-126]
MNSTTSVAPAASAARLTSTVTAPAYPRPRRWAGVYTGSTWTRPATIGLAPAMETGVPSGVSQNM